MEQPLLWNAQRDGHIVNDVHSALNRTAVKCVVQPKTLEELLAAVRAAAAGKLPVSIAGARHAMGGQQFFENGVLLDMSALNRVLSFDARQGTVIVESGITWPTLFSELERRQAENFVWTFLQKQTGADHLSIGGSLSANIHGRGLTFKPLVQDIAAFELITATGELVHCSRSENRELFALAIGGYGLFGVVYAVTLKLAERQKLQRTVRIVDCDDLGAQFNQRIAAGYRYGDFQFSIDPASPNFLRRGVFSCYKPVPAETPIPKEQRSLSVAQWEHLVYLTHADKNAAYEHYTSHYKATDGQLYWSDTHQFTPYIDGYHSALDRKLGSPCPGSEMITELYVPRPALCQFLSEAARQGRKGNWNIIYGTVRLIERDEETLLAWAREPWACVVLNVCVEHSDAGRLRAAETFRKLIDLAIDCSGSYYLTYHRWATANHVTKGHPRVTEFFEHKRRYDPDEIFTSNWYNYYRRSI